MPETDTIPVSASIASTGLGIRYIGTGNRQYAYCLSGVKDPSTGPTTYLEFTSGSGFIVGKFEFNASFYAATGNVLGVNIYYNGVQTVEEKDVANNYLAGDCYFDVLIPPFTKVRVDLFGSDAPTNINFIGRVYGAE